MSLSKVVISRDDTLYEVMPDVVYAPIGKLICIYRESDGHTVREFSKIALRTSLDGGHTWSEPKRLVESYQDARGVVLKWNCPRIQRLRDGRLLALCDVFPSPPDEATDLTNSHIVFWWSDDAGESWSTSQHTTISGIVPDRLVELPSGAWLITSHVRMIGDTPDRQGRLTLVCHRSEDRGQTWQGPEIVGQDDRYDLCEGSVLALGDGTLVCYMRENSRLGLPAFKAFSRDEGRTWEGVFPTLMNGCHRPVAGLLPSGRVLITYRYEPGGKRGPFVQQEPSTWRGHVMSTWARNTFAFLEGVESARSHDIGGQAGIVLPLDHDRSPRSDSGYTGWAVLPDGHIFCVNYIVDDAPMAHIRGYWFTESDF